MRRLPIYLLLDCSESMAGKTLDQMKKGVQILISDLRRDPAALEMAYISIITYGAKAKQIVPLTELCDFKYPEFVLSSGTALGAALDLLRKCIDHDVVKSTQTIKGDYKPIVFIMTDGEPTDSWTTQAHWLIHNRHLLSVVVGIGEEVNTNTLLRLSESVVYIKNNNGIESFSQFFRWVSSSISTASQRVGSEDKGIDLRKLQTDEDMVVVNETTPEHIAVSDKYLFIHAKCRHDGRFYLMKFVKNGRLYDPVESIPVEKFDISSSNNKLMISNDQMSGYPPCPYCGDTWWGLCDCGKIFCQSGTSKDGRYTCPWCHTTNYYSPATFSIGRGAG